MVKLTKRMITPKTTTLKLKLRATGEEVDTEVKLLHVIQVGQFFREAGIKTQKEAQRLCKVAGMEIMPVFERMAAEALSIKERWTVDDVRNAFDIEELVKIVNVAVTTHPQDLKTPGASQAYG